MVKSTNAISGFINREVLTRDMMSLLFYKATVRLILDYSGN